MELVEGPTVSVKNLSLEIGEALDLELREPSAEASSSARVSVRAVTVDGLQGVLMTDLEVRPGETHLQIPAQHMSNLAEGLYVAGPVVTRDQQGREIDRYQSAMPEALFEIRDGGGQPNDRTELATRYHTIGGERDRQLNVGLGEGVVNFEALVFIRDCLITRRMFLGPYEIIPFTGLAISDEVDSVNSFLATADFPPLGDLTSDLQQAQQGQPVFVLHSRIVRGDDVASAGATIESEAELVASLLSVHRSGYGSIFASILKERASGRIHFRFVAPGYRGNLLGGFISGEDPATLREHLNRLRSSDSLQLYVGLYREALRETNPKLRYFRFWSLLETVARSKGYEGSPQRDWSGNVLRNQNGRPKLIQDQAEQIVFELLRDRLGGELADNSVAASLAQGLLSLQVPIWYRRRNCVAHGGDCLCRDPSLPLSSVPKFANCWRARQEIAAGPSPIVDEYLNSMREVARLILSRELRARP